MYRTVACDTICRRWRPFKTHGLYDKVRWKQLLYRFHFCTMLEPVQVAQKRQTGKNNWAMYPICKICTNSQRLKAFELWSGLDSLKLRLLIPAHKRYWLFYTAWEGGEFLCIPFLQPNIFYFLQRNLRYCIILVKAMATRVEMVPVSQPRLWSVH